MQIKLTGKIAKCYHIRRLRMQLNITNNHKKTEISVDVYSVKLQLISHESDFEKHNDSST